YTLETIVQAGRVKIAQTSVPIRTNAELRPSRLFNSMLSYIKKSVLTIVRAYIMYSPLKTFSILSLIPFVAGLAIGVRYLVFFFSGQGSGHTQSLILCSMLIMMGFMTFVIGLQADLIAKNRKLLEDIQYHVRHIDYDKLPETMDREEPCQPEGLRRTDVEPGADLDLKADVSARTAKAAGSQAEKRKQKK
ncbi:MAG: hypothetical protein LUH07_09685, partial [Lachnospiraceae bacterium]|nr:hypothetical protein [Lachnospiraceae bacterium]